MYVHSTEHRAFTEQTLRSDEYELQIFENWNQYWSTELHGEIVDTNCRCLSKRRRASTNSEYL